MLFEKSVDKVLATFTKALGDLEKIKARKMQLVTLNTKLIDELTADSGKHLNEHARADRISARLKEFVA